VAAEQQTHNYYMNIGPLFADPLARQLYAEIASIEQQHVTHYESLIDPTQPLLENWLTHEAMEVYTYYSCLQQESNPRVKAIWERMLSYELGHLRVVADLFKEHERRDPQEIVGDKLPEPIPFDSQREFVRATLANEVDLRTAGPDFVSLEQEPQSSLDYRNHMNSEGSPSETVAAGYVWQAGTELTRKVVNY
jgi:rubrerythrin